jgi:predicted regulator of Ras-like GTPase activity (Roadblock/LC7/MglB family)
MAVADLIQHQCADQKPAQISIQNAGQSALLFFKSGQLVHAQLGNNEGEEVVFTILRWDEGTFAVEPAVEPPKMTITRSWSGLLMEGAKRLDEEANESATFNSKQVEKLEANPMIQNLDEALGEMSAEVNGYIASAVVGMDGLNIAQHTKDPKVNLESVSAQAAMLCKLVFSTTEKVGMGHLEDNLIQTKDDYLFIDMLHNDNQHFLCIIVDRKNGTLGNLRLIAKIYAERLSKIIPR